MKVFVTGATGMIGAVTVRALAAAGHEITGLTSRAGNAPAIEALGARALVGDMRDAASFRDAAHAADVVIHAAAQMPVKVRYSEADVDAFMGADEAAVEALLSALGPSCRAFIYTSGAYAYGDTGTAPVDETYTTAHHHPIMRRKIATENKLLERARAGEVPAMITRPGLVYGDGSIWGSVYLAAMRKKKRAVMPGAGRNIVSFIHDADTGAAYCAIALRGTPGEIYNVVDDEPAPLRDVVGAQAVALGAPPPFSAPGWLVRLVGGKYSAAPTLANSMLSNRKLRALGFEPVHPTYRTGVVAVARAVGAQDATGRT